MNNELKEKLNKQMIEILIHFNFVEVKETMDALNWCWAENPSPPDIKKSKNTL